MKILIVYYSLDGNCAFTAEELRKALNASVLRLETLEEKKRTGLAKYFWGGRQILTHAKPPLKPYAVDLDAYELIIIGSPVWAGAPAPALGSFLDQTKIQDKKIALFCCHRGPKHCLEKMKRLLPGNTVVGELDLVDPATRNRPRAAERIQEWARNLNA
ncbi:MAG: NAD(P)H-dependent oxidoreductase [Treponema sp.]|jgi:flavodoxin|nr:NAD(P)H-dependent oxidoreductase [Treponema sp.]